MSLSATRPPWLSSATELEQILASSQITIPLVSLKSPREYSCTIVQYLLKHILARLPQEPSPFELHLAGDHLSLDVARILSSWTKCGERETLTTNKLVPSGIQTLDVRPTVPAKRRSPSSDCSGMLDSPPSRGFECPFNILDPSDRLHAECADKRFPNPRKLKEHIWRFTKPFKCPTCGEGFGREKTKAIHCGQRKVKCSRNEGEDRYEGSFAQWRDRRIEAARTTKECVEIFETYERRQREAAEAATCIVAQGAAATAAADGWNLPPGPLPFDVYPSTPATTPQSAGGFHSPTYEHSPTTPQSAGGFHSPTYEHSPTTPTFYPSPHPGVVPHIVVSNSQDDGSAYQAHHVPSPVAQSPEQQHFHMLQQHQIPLQRQQQDQAQVYTVQSNGYGSFGPFICRVKTS